MRIDRRLNLTERPAWLAVTGPADRVWWRVLLVILLGTVAAFVLGLAVTAAGLALGPKPDLSVNAPAMAAHAACLESGRRECSVDLVIPRPTLEAEILNALYGGLAVGAIAVGLLVVARPLLKRTLRSYITAAPRFRWGHLLFGLVSMALVCGLLLALESVLKPGSVDVSNAPLTWTGPSWMTLAYLAAATLGLLIAAWSEEVVFRGWLLQQTGAFSRSLPLILGLQAALFSLAHAPTDIGIFVIRLASGLAWGWAALRLAGLEFAIGAHAANNLILAWFVGGMSTMTDSDFSLTLLALELVQCAAVVILAEGLARRSSAAAAPGPSAPEAHPAGPP